jgi:putative FmdB family regulatory protein
MPIYEFQCRKCGARLEVLQKMNDKQPVKCKQCGGRLERLQSAPAIQFKGSGWYVTDYASNGRKAAEKADKEPAVSTSSDDKKSDKSDKSDKKTKESSPAKKTSEKASASKVPKGD